jgi:hypothetical protein
MSDRKVVANRENSKKSTEPKTELGKCRSKFNAYRHGILARGLIFSEDTERSAFKKFFKRIVRDAKPTDFEDSLLVEEIAVLTWKLRKAESIEHEARLAQQTRL